MSEQKDGKGKEDLNPSSRFFGQTFYTEVFDDISLDFAFTSFQPGKVQFTWKVNTSDEIEENPSSRNFGKCVDYGKWMEGMSGDIAFN